MNFYSARHHGELSRSTAQPSTGRFITCRVASQINKSKTTMSDEYESVEEVEEVEEESEEEAPKKKRRGKKWKVCRLIDTFNPEGFDVFLRSWAASHHDLSACFQRIPTSPSERCPLSSFFPRPTGPRSRSTTPKLVSEIL